MSYSVNWTTKVIDVPLGDLTLVSGSNYTLDTGDFWIEMRRLEASPSDGLWAEQAIEYVNTQVLSGITYSGIVKLINGYTWQVASTNKNVSLIGKNSNLLDFHIPGNGISILANNAAGKISSGFVAEDRTKVDEIHTRLDLETANPNTYADDGSSISNATFTLTKSDNGDGSFDVDKT